MHSVTRSRRADCRRPTYTICLGLAVSLCWLSASAQADVLNACLGVAHPMKESSLKDTTIPGDFTMNQVSMTTHFEGSGPNTALQKLDPAAKTFVLGPGNSDSVFGALAAQGQESVWNIAGNFNLGRTLFTDTTRQNVGFFEAGACLNVRPGTSLASTTFKIAGGFDGGTVKITGGAAKDDALANSDVDTKSQAGETLLFSLDGTTALSLATLLQAQLGATAAIVDSGSNAGLTLLATLGQTASFSVVATDIDDPSQSFSWSASFAGTGQPVTAANGVGDPLSFFQPVSGGWFLPFDAMPGQDISANLDSGQLALTGVSSASVATVPEPSSLVLCGTGLLCLIFITSRRQRKRVGPF